MAIKHSTRLKMENYIYNVFNRLDPSKTNTNFYQSFFKKMTDKEFDSFFKKFFEDKDAYLTLSVDSYKFNLTLENIEKAAAFMKVPLYEYVVMPYYSHDKNKPLMSAFPVPVGYIHVKRMQQTAFKKNSSSIEITQRDAKTNQVINADKNGRESIDENYSLLVRGSKKAIKEFMSFRADDSIMKEQAYSDIRQKGYVSINDLPDYKENKATLNMLDTFLICMGIKTNLVTDGLLINKSLDTRE